MRRFRLITKQDRIPPPAMKLFERFSVDAGVFGITGDCDLNHKQVDTNNTCAAKAPFRGFELPNPRWPTGMTLAAVI